MFGSPIAPALTYRVDEEVHAMNLGDDRWIRASDWQERNRWWMKWRRRQDAL
jgi:hypothetical protein